MKKSRFIARLRKVVGEEGSERGGLPCPTHHAKRMNIRRRKM
ncbi:hypothetical protein [Grimontia marina]|uniref:Uncharacterized protein n=1 Tax=Grimontia marina TaxID=646534 RepID=A0A128FCZ6_9GAMM|nr:hypothetical protein [Grimontia marina]CZF84618.1 hypothetical protein GMA8713_03169 [Grimontia marina]